MNLSGTVIRWGGAAAVASIAGAGVAAQDLPPPAAHIQRQADNPLRWIVEAGKLKSRVKAVETVAVARPAAAKPVARGTVARPPERVVAAVPVPVAEPVTAAVVADLPAPADQVALELLAGDEPALPAELDAGLNADAVFELALIVLADGSVGAVSTLSSTHPELDEHAIAAVRGWRFKPLPQAQVHSVELVFHPRH